MKNIITQLQVRIGSGWLRLWHVLSLVTLFWLTPLFMPDEFLAKNILYIGIVFLAIYVILTKLMPKVMRKTTVDIYLIERYLVLLTFAVSLIYGLSHGIRNGFGGATVAVVAILAICTLAIAYSIVLHIKKAPDYYHGVKKTDLFK